MAFAVYQTTLRGAACAKPKTGQVDKILWKLSKIAGTSSPQADAVQENSTGWHSARSASWHSDLTGGNFYCVSASSISNLLRLDLRVSRTSSRTLSGNLIFQ